eukprot:s2_g5.t2
MQLELGAPLAFLPPKLMADDEYDLWDTLHLQPGASLDEVRVAFRELSRVYHPDKRNGASTERAEGENAAFVRGMMILYHATDQYAAEGIQRKGFRCGDHGFAGGAIYFSKNREGACRKYRNGRGNPDILIQCNVDLGKCYEADKHEVDRVPRGFDSVKIRGLDVYAVYDSRRVNIVSFIPAGGLFRYFPTIAAWHAQPQYQRSEQNACLTIGCICAVAVHRAYRILSDEALRGFYEKYGLSGVRLAESLSDEEGAEGAVSLIDDRLKDDIRGGTSTASLKGLTDASGQAEFAGLLSDVENAFAGVTLQSKFVPEPLEEMKGLELGDADDKDYAISLRMLGAPAGVEHIYRFSASSGKMVEMYFRDFKPTLRGLNRQTMDEVKQPLVLERVQSIALQTRSSFGTPAGYA